MGMNHPIVISQKFFDEFQRRYNEYHHIKKEIDIKETIYCDYLREFVKDESYILKRKLNDTDILHL